MSTMDFNGRLRQKTEFINHTLQRLLASCQIDGRLKEALSYTLGAQGNTYIIKTTKQNSQFFNLY